MKTKISFKVRLLDALVELLVTAAFIAIGVGAVVIFGGEPRELDFEVLALIGIGIFAVSAAIIVVAIYIVKKKKRRKI